MKSSFEEFKGTGNMEVHLDRIWWTAAFSPPSTSKLSGTRKEELLYHPEEYNKVVVLRRALTGVPPVEAMELMLNKLKKTKRQHRIPARHGRGLTGAGAVLRFYNSRRADAIGMRTARIAGSSPPTNPITVCPD